MRCTWLVLVVGCGKLHFEPVATPASDGGTDAVDTAPQCPEPISEPFGPPTHLMTLAAPDDDGTPTMSDDPLVLYFKSLRPGGKGGADIWRSTRATPTSAWDAPTPVTEVNSGVNDDSPELSPDGLTLWISSLRVNGLGDYDLWVATRATTSSPWGQPQHVFELSSPALDGGLTVLPSGLVAYLHSTRGGGATKRLYRATRATPSAPWSEPQLIAAIEVGENPWVDASDCILYFQAAASGANTAPEIWRSFRASPLGPWEPPVPAADLSSPSAFDGDPWLAPDQRTIYFSSGRDTTIDLYLAER